MRFSLLILGLYASVGFSQDNLQFFDFPSPETLSVAEIEADINERKQIWTDFILDSSPTFNTVPVFIENGVSFNFDSVVQPVLDDLDSEVDPDFLLMTLVRILFLTEDFNDEILTAVKRIKLWLTTGESLRVYWTENHQIMYTAAAYLLRQKFGEDEFETGFFDEHLDTRLEWFLRTKPETGFFEFNSPIYYQFTTAGLLLLHDFADNSTIKEGALTCLLTGVEEWMPIVSSEGVVTQSAARAFQFFYFADDNMFGNGAQQVIAFLTGLGPLIDTSASVRAVTAALVLTDANLSPAVATYSPQQVNTRQIGLADDERADIFTQLPDFERHIAQLSMGLFGDVTHINDLFEFLTFFDLFDREDFEPLSLLEAFSTVEARVSFAATVESIGTGSSYYVPEFVSYKDSNVVMTSCNDYFPGFKGYQQFPNMAAISTATVFTFAMEEDLFFDKNNGQTQLLGNNQIPHLKQIRNVQVAIYNPRRDLESFGVDLVVLFYFDASLFEEVVNEGNWVFGSLNSAYVGVYREQCVEEVTDAHLITNCEEEVQIWITVVGTSDSHQSFENFRSTLLTTELTLQRSDNCGSAVGTVDGEEFDELFCQGEVDIVIAGGDDDGGNDDDGESEDEGEEEGDEEDADLDIIELAQYGGGGIVGLSIILGICYAVSESSSKKKKKNAPRAAKRPNQRSSGQNGKVPVAQEASATEHEQQQDSDDLASLL